MYRQVEIPKSRFTHEINVAGIATKMSVLVLTNVVLLACIMLAKKISPLIVPTDTVIFNTVRKTTRASPAMAKTINNIKNMFEHVLQSELPSIILRPSGHLPHKIPDLLNLHCSSGFSVVRLRSSNWQ